MHRHVEETVTGREMGNEIEYVKMRCKTSMMRYQTDESGAGFQVDEESMLSDQRTLMQSRVANYLDVLTKTTDGNWPKASLLMEEFGVETRTRVRYELRRHGVPLHIRTWVMPEITVEGTRFYDFLLDHFPDSDVLDEAREVIGYLVEHRNWIKGGQARNGALFHADQETLGAASRVNAHRVDLGVIVAPHPGGDEFFETTEEDVQKWQNACLKHQTDEENDCEYYMFGAPWFEATKVYESKKVIEDANAFFNKMDRFNHALQTLVVAGVDNSNSFQETHVFQFTPMRDRDTAHVAVVSGNKNKEFWVPCTGASSGARFLDSDLMAVSARAVHDLFGGAPLNLGPGDEAVGSVGFNNSDDFRLDLFRFGNDTDMVVIKHSKTLFDVESKIAYVLVSYPSLRNRLRLGASSAQRSSRSSEGSHESIHSFASWYDRNLQTDGNVRKMSFEIRGLQNFQSAQTSLKLYVVLKGTLDTIPAMRENWGVVDKIRQWMHRECLPPQVFKRIIEYHKQTDPDWKFEYPKYFAGDYDQVPPAPRFSPKLAWCIKWLALVGAPAYFDGMEGYADGMRAGREDLLRRLQAAVPEAQRVLPGVDGTMPANVLWGADDPQGTARGNTVRSLLTGWTAYNTRLIQDHTQDASRPIGVSAGGMRDFVGKQVEFTDNYAELNARSTVSRVRVL